MLGLLGRRPLLAAALLISSIAPPVHGQDSGGGSNLCWLRVRPPPRCDAYLVTEASVEVPLLRTSHTFANGFRQRDLDTRWTIAIGGMVNRPDSSAIGGVLTWDVSRDVTAGPIRAEARYRKWIDGRGLDFSGGGAQKHVPSTTGGSARAWGGTMGVGIDFGYIGADARAELLRGDNRTLVGGFVGGRATSAGAPVAVLGALLVIVAVVARVGAS